MAVEVPRLEEKPVLDGIITDGEWPEGITHWKSPRTPTGKRQAGIHEVPSTTSTWVS